MENQEAQYQVIIVTVSSESRGSESRETSSTTKAAPKRATNVSAQNQNRAFRPVEGQEKRPDIGAMRAEILDELYQEFYQEIKEEVRQEVQDSKGQIVREVADELKARLKSDLRKNLLDGKGERE